MIRRALLAATALAAVATGAAAKPSRPPSPPNVLIVMTDDVGFAASSTFGGGIPTPTLDALAEDGLRFANFHTTAICSPTRAALLTGRNHHLVGFGTVADLARDEPGYTSLIPDNAATLAQILSARGWDTAMLGKNHNVPTWQSGAEAPKRQWASGLGFQYFYGFHGGFTDQFAPNLIENDRMIEPPAAGDGSEAGYVLDRDLADRAIRWLQARPTGKPWLMYYAPGTAHAPLQAPREWIARFKGRFDAGWDVYREAALARQKALGLVPATARLAPMPEGTRRWADLSDTERKVAARLMEVHAAMLAYCDAQVGRIVDQLKRSGQYDNTLILFVQGDNGSSGEGGASGALNYATRVSGSASAAQELEWSAAHLDRIGGPDSYPIGTVGWASAMNTPFPYYKTIASRLGGTTNGMVVTWPKGIKARGVRSQFAHVTDVMPTVLEAAGIEAPASVGGIAQMPLDGISLVYSFASRHAPSRHQTQYFEVFGNAAIYHRGWLLAERVTVNQQRGGATPAPGDWQLYDLAKDPSQTSDVAPQHPEKVRELTGLWQAEAARNTVLPLTSSNVRAMLPGTRPEPASEPGRHVLLPRPARLPEGAFPAITNRSWSAEASIAIPADGAEGMMVTQGGRAAGWGLALLGGVPTFLYRESDRDNALLRLTGPFRLAPGSHSLRVSFTVDGPGFGKGGQFILTVDGVKVAEGRLDRTVPFKFSGEDATIGRDAGTALTDDYRLPFAFTGTLESVTFDLGPVQPPPGLTSAAGKP